MDRFYAGYFTLARLLVLGVDFVSRQQAVRRTDFRRGQRLGKRDHVVRLERPKCPPSMSLAEYEVLPLSIELREVCVGKWILISSLKDAKSVSWQELHRLYCWRWQVELDLRAIKAVMQMDVLRCKSPSMVLKEVAAHLLAYNLVRSVMAQAAQCACRAPRELSFKGALQQLRAFEQQLRHGTCTSLARLQSILISSVGRLKLPLRSGRAEPRAVKRRPKPTPLLTQPRAVLKAHLQARHARLALAIAP